MTAASEALVDFYLAEGLPDGGTDGRWLAWGRAFGVPVPIVNTASRVAVLPYHDLHHLVTGYRTDEVGEGEVAAWTLATGGGPLFGDIYDLGAFGLGLLRAPRRVVAAFWRGRQCTNLYRRPAAHWMGRDVHELRRITGTDRPLRPVCASDRAALVRTGLTAAAVWATPLAPLAMLAFAVRDASAR